MLALQEPSRAVWADKYQARNWDGEPIDKTPDDTLARVARAQAHGDVRLHVTDAQGVVLVTQDDLAKTRYRFTTEDGKSFEVAGNEEVEYDGETHIAANLFGSS